jgi:O-antigen/teichoic acid export membrane protein
MQKSALFINYINYLIPLIFFTTLFNLLDTYNRVLYNALAGIAYKEIWQRIFILIAILIYFFEFISFGQLVFLYVAALSLPTILMIIMLFQKGDLTLKRPGKFIDGSMKKEMANIAFFGMITSYSGVVIMNIDIVMINHFLGLSETGIYAITFYFGTLVLLPSRSVVKIASVVIADGWKNNDLEKIREIYYKSNIVLTVTGVFIFLGLVLNLDNIIHVLGDDYASGKYVVLFIALAHLFEMSTGVSQNVINNSIYYRINGYLLLVFVSLLIITNWIFIPIYGITGAAFASAFSRLIYNILSWLFLRIKFNLQPFNIKYFILAIIGVISYFVSSSIPWLNHYLTDMLVRSTIFTIIFVSGIYAFTISSDINQTIISTLKLIKLKK